MTAPLEDRAARHAIQIDYQIIGGATRRAPPETLELLLAAFDVPADDAGLDQPHLRAPDGVRCFLPDDVGQRQWGVALQLYQLRSTWNWGIGDLADLARLARPLAEAGADFIGLNPMHALFLADPGRCSPFSPSNRRFLNPLYIAVDQAPGYDAASMAPDREALSAARGRDLVDYRAVADLKLPALRALWRAAPGEPASLETFRAAGGTALHRHALFEAISAHMTAEGHGAGWHGWPAEWRDVDGRAVADFASRHADEVAFHAWLQWLADLQLAAADAACLAAGMEIGLYLDFAVGEAPDGSGVWSDPGVVVSGVRIGAPPDYFNEAGQDWGLAPLSPVEMRARAAAPFHDLMDDATRRAGALRIDHAMTLWQLFLIPDGMTAAEGAYVRYPVEEMITALARASQHHRTIIVGEDLGNVPAGFREVMQAAGILSYRIFLFERNDDGFIPPEGYPRDALVCLSTHDLPTLQGWWRGDDVTLRAEHGLIASEGAAEQSAQRVRERREALTAVVRADLMDEAEAEAVTARSAPDALVIALHRHLARAPSRLFAVRLEDMAGEHAPVNLPSTYDEYPNWRRKLGLTLEELIEAPLFRGLAGGLAAERPRGGLRGGQS